MANEADRIQEELNRQRNNENGDFYLTPAQDCQSGLGQQWMEVTSMKDKTDENDGKGFPLSS